MDAMKQLEKETGYHYFAEQFIEGREFTIGFLNGQLLPFSEYIFNFPENLHKVKTYDFKWVPGTAEYDKITKVWMDETTTE